MANNIDLLLLHAPSVYDFREKAILYGPISDMIPSSPVFEMYPLGFLTMANYLGKQGYTVRVINLAIRMMNDPDFNVSKLISKLSPKVIGIDLHWLPHAHGSIEIAKICKAIHPATPIVFGGLSASYFHEELIQYPEVDFVIRGDSGEIPTLHLLKALEFASGFESIPNLTWKLNEEIRTNQFSHFPTSLDHIDINPKNMIEMVLKYRDLQSVIPFNGWWQNPITAIFTAKGCAHNCVTCGGAQYACELISKRNHLLVYSPEKLVMNIKDIAYISKGPIFLVGDIRQGGEDHARQIFQLLQKEDIRNEIVFEFFDMPPIKFLEAISKSVKNWSIELSPESHDEAIRQRQDTHTFYTNNEMESAINAAVELGANRVDIFFMIGLPQQTKSSVMESVAYCEKIFAQTPPHVSCFISPMGPFLDPGSQIFENPEKFGYRLFAQSLEEHRQQLVQPSWKQILNFETTWMSREQLVEATYAAGEKLNQLKFKYGRIKEKQFRQTDRRIQQAKHLDQQLEDYERSGKLDTNILKALKGEINTYSMSTVCDKSELYWKPKYINFHWWNIFRISAAYFFSSIKKEQIA